MLQRSRNRWLLAVPLCAALSLLSLGAIPAKVTASNDTLDQQQSTAITTAVPDPSNDSSNGRTYWAQTFTAGLSGPLDRVQLVCTGTVGAPITVELMNVNASSPPSPADELAQATGTCATPGEFNDFVFASPYTVSSDTVYGLVIAYSSSYSFDGGYTNPYAAGDAFDRNVWNAWYRIFNFDFAFKTYVETLSTSPSTGSLTITKSILGAPSGYSGSFTFSVTCDSPEFIKTDVTINGGNGATALVTGIPLLDDPKAAYGDGKNECQVLETGKAAVPSGYTDWVTTYSPDDGWVVVEADSPEYTPPVVTVTNTTIPPASPTAPPATPTVAPTAMPSPSAMPTTATGDSGGGGNALPLIALGLGLLIVGGLRLLSRRWSGWRA